MLILNTDSATPAPGYKIIRYPAGEIAVEVPTAIEDKNILVVVHFRSYADIVIAHKLMQYIRIYAKDPVGTVIKVFIPYFPSARDDKGDCSMMDYVAGHLHDADYIYTFDLHSQRSAQIISPTQDFMPYHLPHLAKLVGHDTRPVEVIIAPDKGAVNRAEAFRAALDRNIKIVVADKVRDQATGRITSYELPECPNVGRTLIVDDICDGGATFNMLAAEFAARQPFKYLDLWVSHGIFSKGTDALSPIIRNIYTTDSYYQPKLADAGRVTCISLVSCLYDKLEKIPE